MFKKIIAACAPMVALYTVQFCLDRIYGDICQRVPHLDTVMHTLGGFVTAWSGLLLYQVLKKQYPSIIVAPRRMFYALLVGFAAFSGVVWEHYEYLHDIFLYSKMQSSIDDTMKDLFLDLLGAIIFCIVLSRHLRKKKLKPGEY